MLGPGQAVHGARVSRQDPNGYYRLLGLTPDAAPDEIARAFRTLAKTCHPDRNPDPAAAARFKLLSEAYATLSTAEGRAAYGRDPFAAAGRGPGSKSKLMGQVALGVAAPVIAVGLWLQGHLGDAARTPPPAFYPIRLYPGFHSTPFDNVERPLRTVRTWGDFPLMLEKARLRAPANPGYGMCTARFTRAHG